MSRKQQKQTLNAFLLAFVLFVLGVIVFMIKTQLDLRQRASETPELTITPAANQINEDQTLILSLGVDSKTTPINGVVIVLTYPKDKLTLKHLDTSNSPFSVQSEYISQDGYLRVGRDATAPFQGVQLIATVTFDKKESVTLDEIKIQQETKAIKEDNKTIFLSPKVLKPTEQANSSNVLSNILLWITKTIGIK